MFFGFHHDRFIQTPLTLEVQLELKCLQRRHFGACLAYMLECGQSASVYRKKHGKNKRPSTSSLDDYVVEKTNSR